MIGRLRGRVVEAVPGRMVLDVGGVGYDVRVPESAGATLRPGPDEVAIWTHAAYPEGAAELYGFLSAAERDAFRQIIGVSGVGPRTALALLSAMPLDDLRSAILRDDSAPLLRVTGVGRKTAQRLLLELKEKAMTWAAAEGPPGPEPSRRREDDLAVAALTNLGYRPAQAARAVEVARQKLGSDAPFDDLVRRALQEAV